MWSDSEIRLGVSPLEADISESESQAASPRSKRGTRPGRPLEAGGACSKLGAPARSGRLPASVLRPSAALNAVAGRDAKSRPLLGAPAPRCRHTEALWPAAALAMRSESRPAERQCMPAQATMQVLVSPDRIAYHIPDKERSRRSSNGSSCLVTRLQRICVSALRLIDCA